MTDKIEIANATLDDKSFSELAMGADALDALFSDARESAPNFASDNFTKMVLNSIPEEPVRRKASGVSFELIGVLVGLVIAYFMIDFNSLIRGFIAMMPHSITLSPMHMLIALGGISAMSVAAWWVVERSR
ncbi:hypothetical protein [Arenicella xantha]|uniref:Uncharacterized protein n=1 Tax=Arenicella xantha TaxID=644221 RepID=A0A395JQ84_9GAMM|nr:hypothetical protein [Arenicella xantha]RBP50870.1 hypothetical protein DFR28_102286 [Arenicella xantha]